MRLLEFFASQTTIKVATLPITDSYRHTLHTVCASLGRCYANRTHVYGFGDHRSTTELSTHVMGSSELGKYLCHFIKLRSMLSPTLLGIVILCEAFCLLSHHPGATRPLVIGAGIEPANLRSGYGLSSNV